ncbi:TNT domain-containing protein [Amycolatopsis sp. H20-H5]|uniref:TNT domain-containing protein n=1 Tax=Amycolatopsis sp. H20-H5 TaxID=3046309 RepID=UPI002DB8726D|nr:TNT domain-containing protein [Amycolatopsis sp. H20-H5]MEC3978098.1 TNT domain-containing protein [Amycolatopsis sp. H20-H5]
MTEQSEAGTGPIRLPVRYGGLLAPGGFEDVPTPRSGTPLPFAPAPWPPVLDNLQRPVPLPPPPHQKPPLGSPRQERQSIVALFLVHLFPIGHLPVAADKPARQLPAGGLAYAAGLRFAPFDHPESGLLTDEEALSHVSAGFQRAPTLPPVAPPAELLSGHDPLGGLPERDWDRRFLAGTGLSGTEYAWPPGEMFPEGSAEAAEPVVLDVGTELDRFGDAHGRILAPAATPFAHRSLPPSAVTNYRRYRVTRALPAWRSVSAAWFGVPGGGVRLRTVLGADELVTLGFLADLTGEQP